MEGLRTASLLAATIALGLTAGVFWLYAHAVMPGLRRTTDRTFVGAFQEIDRAIMNPQFLLTFLGGLVLPGAASLLQLGADDRPALPWAVAATALYLVVVVATVRLNVPRNDALKAAGDPESIDVAAARASFDEAAWSRVNIVRAALTTAAFACAAWALVEQGGTL